MSRAANIIPINQGDASKLTAIADEQAQIAAKIQAIANGVNAGCQDHQNEINRLKGHLAKSNNDRDEAQAKCQLVKELAEKWDRDDLTSNRMCAQIAAFFDIREEQ